MHISTLGKCFAICRAASTDLGLVKGNNCDQMWKIG